MLNLAPENTKRILYLPHANASLALHTWLPKSPKAALFYIHGLQSHAGWLFDTAPYLNSRSIAVFALDRRGSGLSEGLRGDVISLNILLADYRLALEFTASYFKELPLILLGQSLGGSILAGLLSQNNFTIPYRSSIFCSAALGQMHHKLSDQQVDHLLTEDNTELISTNLIDEQYTNHSKYLSFIKGDPLCLRHLTNRSRIAFYELESLYLNARKSITNKSSVFFHAEKDDIINLAVSQDHFASLTGQHGKIIEIDSPNHYLEFSKNQRNIFSDFENFILTTATDASTPLAK